MTLFSKWPVVDEDVLQRFHIDTIELGRSLRRKIDTGSTGFSPMARRARCLRGSGSNVTVDRQVIRSKSGRVIAQMLMERCT